MDFEQLRSQAQNDQGLAAWADLARFVKQHYDALVAEGFEPFQALMLAAALQSQVLINANQNDGPNP